MNTEIEDSLDFNRLEVVSTRGVTCRTYIRKLAGRPYFVKRLLPELADSDHHRKALHHEFEFGKTLLHPSLPRMVDMKLSDCDCYLVMEGFCGLPLSSVCSTRNFGMLERGIIINILLKLIDALEYLHAKGITRLDLLPHNVLVSDDLEDVMIADLDKVAYLGSQTSTDADFRALGRILSRCFPGVSHAGEFNRFLELCRAPGITSKRLRECLESPYDNFTRMMPIPVKSGSCDVFDALWDGKPVFIKRQKPEFRHTPSLISALEQEYTALQATPCVHGVRYLAYKSDEHDCAVIMDKVEGETLASLIKRRDPWLRKRTNIRMLLARLLDFMESARLAGLGHLGFTPADILLSPSLHTVTIAHLSHIPDTRRGRPQGPDEELFLPSLCVVINHLRAAGTDVSWLKRFYYRCYIPTPLSTLRRLLADS